jgi:hypothetical protein
MFSNWSVGFPAVDRLPHLDPSAAQRGADHERHEQQEAQAQHQAERHETCAKQLPEAALPSVQRERAKCGRASFAAPEYRRRAKKQHDTAR